MWVSESGCLFRPHKIGLSRKCECQLSHTNWTKRFNWRWDYDQMAHIRLWIAKATSKTRKPTKENQHSEFNVALNAMQQTHNFQLHWCEPTSWCTETINHQKCQNSCRSTAIAKHFHRKRTDSTWCFVSWLFTHPFVLCSPAQLHTQRPKFRSKTKYSQRFGSIHHDYTRYRSSNRHLERCKYYLFVSFFFSVFTSSSSDSWWHLPDKFFKFIVNCVVY